MNRAIPTGAGIDDVEATGVGPGQSACTLWPSPARSSRARRRRRSRSRFLARRCPLVRGRRGWRLQQRSRALSPSSIGSGSPCRRLREGEALARSRDLELLRAQRGAIVSADCSRTQSFVMLLAGCDARRKLSSLDVLVEGSGTLGSANGSQDTRDRLSCRLACRDVSGDDVITTTRTRGTRPRTPNAT